MTKRTGRQSSLSDSPCFRTKNPEFRTEDPTSPGGGSATLCALCLFGATIPKINIGKRKPNFTILEQTLYDLPDSSGHSADFSYFYSLALPGHHVPDSNIWLSDSGATEHMSNNRTLITLRKLFIFPGLQITSILYIRIYTLQHESSTTTICLPFVLIFSQSRCSSVVFLAFFITLVLFHITI